MVETVLAAFVRACFYQDSGERRLISICSQPGTLKGFFDAGSVFLDVLKREYCRLFVGPEPVISPYESFHREDKKNGGRYWGDVTVEVKKKVEALGLAYADDFTQMPDRISVEFEVMQRLLESEELALNEGHSENRKIAQEAQTAWYHDHLTKWIPDLGQKLEEESQEAFYRDLGKLTHDFLMSEKKFFSSPDLDHGRKGS